MQEDFLHYLWKHKKFDVTLLKSSNGETIEIQSIGQHNLNSGPDFFNAKLIINNQLWAGNVEIHIKSSDWFVHNHEVDKAYDNVILHVVWEHDLEIYRKDNTQIPALELKNYVSEKALKSYQKLFSKPTKWINCESEFGLIDNFIFSNWLERLYFERLERKSHDIESLLKVSAYNWEEVLFKMLTKNFGLKVNSESFLSIANSFNFIIIRKQQDRLISLEALLFGQAGLLSDKVESAYYISLIKEYNFLKQKYSLSDRHVLPVYFFRLRPSNFPTIRLAQLANLYHLNQHLFSKIIKTNSVKEFYQLFKINTSSFWESHYTFNKSSRILKKELTKPFIDLLLINTIIPIKFSYAKYVGKYNSASILKLIQEIKSETNSTVKKFYSLKNISKSALNSQALLQLKNEYCDKNKCLQCAIGHNILTRIDKN